MGKGELGRDFGCFLIVTLVTILSHFACHITLEENTVFNGGGLKTDN